MRRTWTTASVVTGCSLVAYAAASFALNLGGDDVSEALGGLALVLGLFFVGEGALRLWRIRMQRRIEARDKP